MARTYSLHTTDCAVVADEEDVDPGDYPDARWHRCGYYLDPKPLTARVTWTDEIVPEVGEKENPGDGSWVLATAEPDK